MEILYRHIQKIHSISKEAQIALGQICKELTIKKNENIDGNKFVFSDIPSDKKSL